jgi:hypothetical protein
VRKVEYVALRAVGPQDGIGRTRRDARRENNLAFPFAALLDAIPTCHCTPVSIGQGGPGLGTMRGWKTAEALLREAGFASVERHVLPHDPMHVWFMART